MNQILATRNIVSSETSMQSLQLIPHKNLYCKTSAVHLINSILDCKKKYILRLQIFRQISKITEKLQYIPNTVMKNSVLAVFVIIFVDNVYV